MIITCTQCDTGYFLDEDRIKPSGSKVRCSKCQNIFVAFLPTAGKEDPVAAPTQPSDPVSDTASDTASHQVPDQASGIQPAAAAIPTIAAAASLIGSKESEGSDPVAEPDEIAGPDDSDLSDLVAELDDFSGSDEGDLSDLAAELDIFSDTDEDELTDIASGIDESSGSETDEMSDLTEGLGELLGPDTTVDEDTADMSIASEDTGKVENQEMQDLTSELDSILGSDDMLDDSPGETGSDLIDESVDELGTDLIEEPESAFLDDEFDQVFGDRAAGTTDKESVDPARYDSNIEMLDLSELDEELDEMFTPEKASDDSSDVEAAGDIPVSEDDIDLDTIQIQDLDSELENIEEIPSNIDGELDLDFSLSEGEDVQETSNDNPLGFELDDLELSDPAVEETDIKEDSTPAKSNLLDADQLEELDLDLDLDHDLLETQDTDTRATDTADDAALDDDFVLDTKQIKALDLELDLEDGPVDEVDAALNTQQIDGLDLEFDDLETLPDDEADFVLNTQQIDGLDLEIEEIKPSETVADGLDLEEIPADASDLSLDTAQIKTLDQELKAVEATESTPEEDTKEDFDKNASITLDTNKGKQAEVLNINLERTDLDESYEDEEIDLPILDELLAPAEVIDDSLLETTSDEQLSFNAEDKSMGEDLFSLEKEPLPLEPETPVLEPETPVLEKMEMEDLDLDSIEMEKETDAEVEIKPEAPSMPEPDTSLSSTAEATIVEPTTDSFSPIEEAAAYPEPTAYPEKKSRKSLIALLIIALLLGGLYYAVTALGINIPYLSDLMGNKTQQAINDPGSAQLKTQDIDSKFVTNKKDGRLFVITGKVINQYKDTRGFIRIKGNVFAKGGKLIKVKSVYCGNVLSDLDLEAKPVAEIQKQLSNKLGAGGADSLKVGPGKTLPFMIVLADLPTDIEEFSLEVLSSTSQ